MGGGGGTYFEVVELLALLLSFWYRKCTMIYCRNDLCARRTKCIFLFLLNLESTKRENLQKMSNFRVGVPKRKMFFFKKFASTADPRVNLPEIETRFVFDFRRIEFFQ